VARFDPLTKYLEQVGGDAIILTFDEVEALSGARLPRSARKAKSPFWSNSPRNVYARHWMEAGFEAGFDECGEGEVCFTRVGAATSAAGGDLIDLGDLDDVGGPGDVGDPLPPPPPPPPVVEAPSSPPPPTPLSTLPPPPAEVTRAAGAATAARAVSETFTLGQADLVERRGARASGWDQQPEAQLATRLRAAGVDDVWIRLVLTFGALVDRGRSRADVWSAVGAVWDGAHDRFDPATVAKGSLADLGGALAAAGLTRRLVDVASWRLLAEAIDDGSSVTSLVTAVYAGVGDAATVLAELAGAGVPALANDQAARRWIRSMVSPGGATIGGLAAVDLVVDGDVRRATEMLGLASPTDTAADIESLWSEACRTNPPAGPPGLTGTPLGLDPALAYHGRVGCRWCRANTRVEPIGPACEACILQTALRTT
jgi:hypothetical protein